ncbi:CmcJ/NvfI family oxidoreductase [Rhodopila sp.]|uniref:CmcJ/NvfI family oxidoreductase n=1 Tax=Rhodopila sp. TaxID=2480087 RepID=UPI003D125870
MDVAIHLPCVEGAVVYLAKTKDKPHTYTYDPPEGVAKSNIISEQHVVPIHDMRPLADGLALDTQGFLLTNAPTAVRDFYNEAELRDTYYAEAEALVKQATGASRVMVFDHTIRRREHGVEDRTPGTARQPVTRIYGDYTELSGPQRVRDLMGAEAETLLTRRFAIVNVWRPIRGPLTDAPLAVCDAGSLANGDLVPQDLIYRDRTGEIYGLTYNPAHRWYYAPDMRAEEALLLKCYDSAHDGRARFMPHTSFQDPNAPLDGLPRESIELRTLVFF